MATASAVAGLGLSWAALTTTDAATAALPAERQGTAAGAVGTATQVGTALGIAGLVTVAGIAGSGHHDAAHGYVVAFAVSAALAAATSAALVPGARARRAAR
jgi:MFS family permease